jgi:hypothetical protein
MRRRSLIVITAAMAALWAPQPRARELKPQAVTAFERYVRLTEARMEGEVAGSSPFLWLDRQKDPARAGLLTRLGRGEVVSAQLDTRDGARRIDAPSALIHHWIGTVLLPGVPLDRAAAFVQRYERYRDVFTPMIQRAIVLNRSGDVFDVAMRTWAKKVITVVLDADYRVEYRRLSPARLYTKSVASRIHEIADAGQPSERRTPSEEGRGYLWRLHTYCWFEAEPEGTYEQCESVSLTANAPWLFRPIVKPFIKGIPRETLEFTLGRVRERVGQ